MIKTTGAEFKRYLNDDTFWPEGAYYDEEVLTVDNREWNCEDGTDAIPDSATVRLFGGVVFSLSGKTMKNMGSHFNKWRKTQKATSFIVECDLDRLDEIKAAIKSAGGKVK